jgi:hypothetical protein
MATQHAVDEANIRQLIEKLVQAIRAMDLESVKPIYAPDIVAFGHSLNRISGTLQNGSRTDYWVRWVAFRAESRPPDRTTVFNVRRRGAE